MYILSKMKKCCSSKIRSEPWTEKMESLRYVISGSVFKKYACMCVLDGGLLHFLDIKCLLW